MISSHVSVIDGGLSSSEGRNDIIHQREPIMPKQEDIDSDCEVIGDDTVPCKKNDVIINLTIKEWYDQKSSDSLCCSASTEF